MKHKLKKILCLTIFSMLFAMNSCQKDDDKITTEKQKIKLERINLNDIPFIKNDIERKKLKNLSSRSGEIDYLSLINPNIIIRLTDSINQKSYTFSLNLEEENEMTNLVIQEKQDSLYYYVLKYSSPQIEQWKEDIDNKRLTQITPTITYNFLKSERLSNQIVDICYQTSTRYVCPSGQHDEGSQVLCEYYFEQWQLVSTTTQGPCSGSSSSSTGSSSPNTGGNTGSGSGTINTPCNKIKGATSNNSAYMSNFRNINKPSVLSQPMEKGFSQVGSQYIYGQAIGGEAVKIPPGAKNFTHTHPNRPFTTIEGDEFHGNVKMHSPADLLALLTTCQNANTDPTNTFGVMISDEGIFAITLLEAVTPAEISQINPKWKNFIKGYEYESGKIISDYRDPEEAEIRKEKTQKLFLKLLKDLGLENKVGLFEGEEELDINIKINWTRKKLDTSGILVPEGC